MATRWGENCQVLDAIIGHYLSDTLDIESVIQPIKEAVTMHGIPDILNSDQGCQFTSAEYKVLLKGLQYCGSLFHCHLQLSKEIKFLWMDIESR